ncbi:MAG: glycosyltransferase [Candidatus Bathyarchaeia archaeon]
MKAYHSIKVLTIIANPIGRHSGMIGGNEINVIEILRRISKHGIIVETIEPSPAASLAFKADYKVYQVRIPPLKSRKPLIDIIKFFFWIVGSFKVILNLRHKKYDAVVAATCNISDTIPAQVACKLMKAPMVINHQAAFGTGSFLTLYRQIRADNATLLDAFVRSAGLMLSLSIAKNVDVIICNSKSAAASLKKIRGKIYVVNMGIDADYIDSIHVLRKEYDAAFMARIEKSKGILDLLLAWYNVIKQCKNAKLIIIGDGSYLYKAKTLARTLHIEKNVDFVGFIRGNKKYVYLKKSKIFIYPSSTVEGSPRVVLEAMSCGLPVILYDNPTIDRNLKACRSVILLPMGDVIALSNMALKLLTMKEEDLIELGQISKKYAKQFSWDATVSDYANILKNLLAR